MKTLTTEQQNELQEVVQEAALQLHGMGLDLENQLRYWSIELKPKRRKVLTIEQN